MKINVKKIVNVALSVVLILAMSMTALAAPNEEPVAGATTEKKAKAKWVYVDGHYKYLTEGGSYATSSWIKKITDEGTDRWYVDANGYMVKSDWYLIDGKYYAFGADGRVAEKTWVKRDDGSWIWSAGNGLLTMGWITHEGKDYHFNYKGTMDTGWLQENNTKYFLLDNGAKAYGWVEANDKWYYMDPDNNGMMTTGNKIIDGKRYLFDYVTGEMRSQ